MPLSHIQDPKTLTGNELVVDFQSGVNNIGKHRARENLMMQTVIP